MTSSSFRSGCPINLGLEVFGDKWTLLIIRDMMFAGKRHFREFLASDEGISTNILSDRLTMLTRAGIVTRADARSHADGRGGEDHRAVRQLAEGAPGVAAFADFCTATGEGLAWADAFRDAFGLAPDELAGDPGADATA